MRNLSTGVLLSRRRFLLAGGLAGAGLTLAACASGAGSAPGGSSAPRTLRMAGGEFGYPTPFTMAHGSGLLPMRLVFDTLMWQDAAGLQPWLAESAEMADDTTCRVRLREDVTWSDGTKLTGEDVAFTVNYLKQHQIAWSIPITVIDRADASGSSIEMRLKEPHAGFLPGVLGAMPVIPKHIWDGVSEPEKKQDEEALVGTGAYALQAHDLSQGTYRFASRQDYFLGRPYFDRVEFVPAANPLLALREGAIDVADIPPNAAPDVIEPFTGGGEFDVIRAVGATATGLFLNNEKPPFADPRIRQAVARAIDRAGFVERVLHGRGEPGEPGFLPRANPLHVEAKNSHGHDVAAARQALAGTRITGTLLADTSTKTAAEYVARQLAQVGIDLEVAALDPTRARESAAAGAYEAAVLGFGGLHSDPTFLFGFFDSRMSKKGRFTKSHGYHNAEFEELQDRQERATDPGERRRLVGRMQQILADEVPMVVLGYPERAMAFRAATAGAMWYYTPGGYAAGNPGGVNPAAIITGRSGGTGIAG
ncbi:ABC transporter substrate-binding protein [Pseudonocardia hispaniensis]|uniref:ABC transporter substrate-binding protein n=1 Tax=Pseudonocardia hispaniensis TaxID=904933 RepID=A0ABW1IYJ7_9PSEU